MNIQNREIGTGHPCFVIAELSGNHHQRYEEAVELIKQAKEVGADAVKLQTYTPETITLNSDREWFVVSSKGDQPDSWKNRTLHDLYATACTPWEWQPKLKRLADELGIILFSSPFDETAVDFLEAMEVPCYKVASYEAVHIPLLRKVASKGKPVIISIGYASLREAEFAVQTLRQGGAGELAVLHCVTSYADTPRVEHMNLRTIQDIAERFSVITGFSDNNGGIEAPVAAVVAGGAKVLEKHFILDRSSGGPDERFSLEPAEFKRMIELIKSAEAGDGDAVLREVGVKDAERAMGAIHYGPASPQERDNIRFRPGVWAKVDIGKGETLTRENIRVARPAGPAGSLMPKDFEKLLGMTAKEDIAFATPLSWNLIEFVA
ncbi:MAG: N-acetylneuraminate synthase family protein [Candidatus Yanofskybacteria bacterium]|nr:N-acetylneuraminate synthase family protein [Candidatus Yanofskybacteria bacterium]